jgi:hypothetical protein
MLDAIARQRMIEAFPRVVADWLGGQDVVEALERHANGESIRAIAAALKVPRSSIHERMKRAEVKLRRLKMWPVKRLGPEIPHKP